jgi:NADH-quinone oxidoreductase subunit F
MGKLKSIKDFVELQNRLLADKKLNEELSIPTIVIPAGTCGQASGANDLIRVTKREILERDIAGRVNLRITGCNGYCEKEPLVLVEPYGYFYPEVSFDEMGLIVEATSRGEPAEGLLIKDPETHEPIEKQSDIPFFKKQVRTLLSQNEKVDPIRIYNYIENGGYSALVGILEKADSSWVIEEVKSSGIRGRGGAGFPTGLKWQLLADQRDGRGKFIVCNADEGDPGAYMDRSLLEGNPHSIIEGMLVCAYGTGATAGVIYVRNEYPLAIKHLVIALRQARELGLLGEDILGTGFSFDIEIVRGAGAFVCGEETALIKSVEGFMGEPRQRPPYPIEKGIWKRPTCINNVETLANIPVIINRGGAEYAKIGVPNNTGTKIFSLVGKIKNTGLVEVPLGIKISDVVYDIGGGPVGKAKIKAVQTGGPSGGCIPASMFDLPIDYDSLSGAGSIMGSGGMIVMDDNTCMVDIAKYFTNFLKDESCGKCFTCRKGTQRMYEILDGITTGNGTIADLDLIEELADVVKDTTMCGLGQTASNPVLSTLRYFRNEYERHIIDKRCDAGVCSELVGPPCQGACPIGTEAWRYVALTEKGDYEGAYLAIREVNPFPSVCARVCHHPCEDKCRSGTTGLEPIAIRALKRFITDRVDPMVYEPDVPLADEDAPRVAVIGSGPAGLTAAHYLSIKGYKVTVFETEAYPGGMLISGIPPYRLDRDTLRKEIDTIINQGNITLKLNADLGHDFDFNDLFDDGYAAVFLATGAHRSRRLNIRYEEAEGVYPSIVFLKSLNLRGKELAQGRVGVIGGGNSALDAARSAMRQEDVDSVTIYYRRTQTEMPAYDEEIEAALEEGIKLETLVSPVSIKTEGGHVVAVKFIRNELGERDLDGRRKPVPIEGAMFSEKLDTLIVAIGEQHGLEDIEVLGLEEERPGRVSVDPKTLETNRAGVFAGGDVVTGPNTVVDAIAAGKKAAEVIDRYIRGEDLWVQPEPKLPDIYIEPAVVPDEEAAEAFRVSPGTISVDTRRKNFDEVELVLSEDEAHREARRCLRCDLEFTRVEEMEVTAATGDSHHD